jgi:hypothetical protein
MPIPIISNFSLSVPEPIDTRIITTNSNSMQNMLYKYEGLTTYRTDENLSYTWNGSAWNISSNGIYGGSGKLIQSDTFVDSGTLSTTQDAVSKKLTLLSYTNNVGNNVLYLEQYFERHTSDASGLFKSGQYKSQLCFEDKVEGDFFEGPYIAYNPAEQNSNGWGGISFGAYSSTFGTNYERLRIEGNGLIRFKPQEQPGPLSKSLNIGIDSPSKLKPFIGYNWNGEESENAPLQQASYIEFNESITSINSYDGTSVTPNATFEKGLITLSGGLRVIGGTISTSRSLQFGTDDANVYFIRTPNNFGIRYDGQRKYAELVGSVTGVTPVPLLRWGPVNDRMSLTALTSITFTFSTTNLNLFASTLRSEYKTQLWDNVFNPDYERLFDQIPFKSNKAGTFSDLNFIRLTAEDAKNAGDAEGGEGDTVANDDNIRVSKFGHPSDPSSSTTLEFRILIGKSYTVTYGSESTFAKNTFYVEAKDYDRIYYFYLDGMRRHINHQVRWWLGEPTSTAGTFRYVQIGNIETGNKENYGTTETTSYGNVSYRSRFYSQTVFVPAFMRFKIQWRFHVTASWTSASTEANSPRVFMNVIRSGKFRLLPTTTPTEPPTPLINQTQTGSGLGYPGSTSETGGVQVGVVVVGG